MKNKITKSIFVGALAVLASVAPLLSGTAQAKHDEKHDNGKHLGWDKNGQHKGTEKAIILQHRAANKPGQVKWGTNRPNSNRRTTWNKTNNHRTTWNNRPRRTVPSGVGALLSSSSYSNRAAAQAAADRARRNGQVATVGYDAPGHQWITRVYQR